MAAGRLTASHAEIQYNVTGGVGARTLAFGHALAVGNLLVVNVVLFSDGTGEPTCTVSGGVNGAYTRAGNFVDYVPTFTHSTRIGQFYFLRNTTNTAEVVSVTPSTDAYVSISIDEYTGPGIALAALRTTASNIDVNNNTSATIAAIPSQLGDLVVVVASQNGTDNISQFDAPFTMLTSLPGAPTKQSIATAIDLGALGSVSATMRWPIPNPSLMLAGVYNVPSIFGIVRL